MTDSRDPDDLIVLKQVASGAFGTLIDGVDLASTTSRLQPHGAFLGWLSRCLAPCIVADTAGDEATLAMIRALARENGTAPQQVGVAAWSSETPRSVDLLHVAGASSVEQARQEFESWRPRLSNRAVVLISGLREPESAAASLWEEFAANLPSFEFRHGDGLGVLGLGGDLPPALRQLFDAASDPIAARNIRNFFSSLAAQDMPPPSVESEAEDDRPQPRPMPAAEAPAKGGSVAQTVDRLLQRHARSLWRKLHARDLHRTSLGGSTPKRAGETARAAAKAKHVTPPAPTSLKVRRVETLPPEPSTPGKLLVCVSHVAPFPPRAGNEYRIDRMLGWLRGRGWGLLLIVCPLGFEQLSDGQCAELARRYGNCAVLSRDGELRYAATGPAIVEAFDALDDRPIRDIAALLNEKAEGETARLLPITRDFCPDALAETLAALDASLTPEIVLANYVFMTRALPLLRREALKMVDTHDVFSTKAGKVASFGVEDSLQLTSREEAALLSRADLAIAIQPEEAHELRAMAPEVPVVTAGVDMPDVAADPSAPPASEPVVLLVGSDNAMNAKGLRDFLRFAWPRVLAAVPAARLHVVGSVGAILDGSEPGVHALGRVDDLAAAYRQARLAVNPGVAGTGLKIKTLEALANLRPIVLWPTGIEGMSPELRALCERVTDWFAFAEAVIHILTDDAAARRVAAASERIAALLSPDAVYADFEQAMTEGLHRARRAVPA